MTRSSTKKADYSILEHDTYRSRTKPVEPTLCTTCGAVFLHGEWGWSKAPKGAKQSTCPACRRIEDRFPAGHVEMGGNFFEEHQEEILNMVKDIEKKEKEGHPMDRIMKIEQRPDSILIKTTGTHIARGIGDALFDAFHGKETICYLDGEKCVRVTWRR